MKVAGQTVSLELPSRPSVRVAIAVSGRDRNVIIRQQTAIQVVAAALLLCWPTGMLKAAKAGCIYRHNLLEFGADAIDFLMLAGAEAKQSDAVTQREIIAAGNAALDLVMESMVTPEELEEARGNSEAPGATNSANSSGSTASGAANQAG